jgi:lipoprotein-anchoring transpeptidase ErfK/SrfK
MRLVCFVCAAAAIGVFASPGAAEPASVLAATEIGATPTGTPATAAPASTVTKVATAPIEAPEALHPGHQASDAALSAAVEEGLPEEVEEAKPLERPDPTLFAYIDLTSQRMTVRDADGNEYGPWKISSARGGYKTPTGTYTVNWTSRMHYSKQYHNSPMPYSVFFNRGVAVHGTSAVGRLGSPASHGCVRVHTKNAKTFYNLVAKHGNKLTQVVVTGTPPYTPAVAERRQRRRYAEPAFSPFGFFNAPSYQQKKRRYRKQYGSSW